MKKYIYLYLLAGLQLLSFATSENFTIAEKEALTSLVFDAQQSHAIIGISSEAFCKDVELITDRKPAVKHDLKGLKRAIIVGTIGKSKFIDEAIQTGKLKVDKIRGQWESFKIAKIDQPFPGMDQALFIVGSDDRATAYGVFELSKRLGISPLVYWADVMPEKRIELSLGINEEIVFESPSVKFRGIFLNDEDWGLMPWAAKKMDADVKNIGPKTYAKIFEMLLRLKANHIWPAMHKCTKAFFYFEANREIAAQYKIVIGSSHCEPMLRNNVDEWKKNFKTEYKKKPGPWDYRKNKDEVHRYWEDRVKLTKEKEIDGIFTIGMRGVHDGKMPGPKDLHGKVALLQQIINDQRKIFDTQLSAGANQTPQIFCPYKEVLELYQNGLKVPEDVTLMWADDNHGYIRKLSNEQEQKRPGGSGVYYHLSYWGAPEDYLWLSSISPNLVAYEMLKAYEYGADKAWVFNVGDIKPAEMEIQFAMDLAWSAKSWTTQKTLDYTKNWAAETFGGQWAQEITQIKQAYYLLAAAIKPEHIDRVPLTKDQILQRLADYEKLEARVEKLNSKMPKRLHAAFFQLIYYPVMGSSLMNQKHYYWYLANETTPKSQELTKKAQAAYERIQKLTHIYNKELVGGKWNGIMHMAPRNRPVFKAPDKIKVDKKKNQKIIPNPIAKTKIAVDSLQFKSTDLEIIPNLGITGKVLHRTSYTGLSYTEDNYKQAPVAKRSLALKAGHNTLDFIILPNHPIHENRQHSLAIKIADQELQIIKFNAPAKSKPWYKNVLRGYASASIEFKITESQDTELEIYFLDPGLALSEIHLR